MKKIEQIGIATTVKIDFMISINQDRVINTALKNIKDQDLNVRLEALNVFIHLVKKEKGYGQAIEASQVGIKDQDWRVSYKVLKLFIQLVKKEQGYDKAIEAVTMNIKDENLMVISVAEELKELLQEKGEWPVEK